MPQFDGSPLALMARVENTVAAAGMSEYSDEGFRDGGESILKPCRSCWVGLGNALLDGKKRRKREAAR